MTTSDSSTTTMPTARQRRGSTGAETIERRLRGVLLANAATSLATGLVGASASSWSAARLGVEGDAETVVRVVGIGLLVFAAAVAAIALRERAHLRGGAVAVTAADVAWVLATVVVLATCGLSGAGVAIAIVTAVGVLDFALIQRHLVRRLPS